MNILKLQEELGIDISFTNANKSKSYLVYLLCDKSEVVYVGMTTIYLLSNRLKYHSRNKSFTRLAIIKHGVDIKSASCLENFLIHKCKPVYNKRIDNLCVKSESKAINILNYNVKLDEVYTNYFKGLDKKEYKTWVQLIETTQDLPSYKDGRMFRLFKKAVRGWYHVSITDTSIHTANMNKDRYLKAKRYLESIGCECIENAEKRTLQIKCPDV